ncbi:MAG: ATP-binding protein [Tahibacter sp.]
MQPSPNARPPANLRVRLVLGACALVSLVVAALGAGLLACGWLRLPGHAAAAVALPASLGTAVLLGILGVTLGGGVWWLQHATLAPLRRHAQKLRRAIDETTPSATLPESPFVEFSLLQGVLIDLQKRGAAAITARESAQAAVGAAKRHLGAALNERDQQLARQTDELRSALNVANDAILARDSLLANTSHEIRTPLYGIIGSAELLRLRLSAVDDVRDTEAILRSAEHLLQLINDLLDFSRINAGKLELASQPFSVADEISAAVTAVQPVADHRKLRIQFHNEIPPHDLRKGDALRVRQIVLNLISNAVKFTEQGGVTVTVAAVSDERIRIVVADTGVGIAPEDQGRIFRAFEQADGSASRRFQGSGLGLAIIDKLVALMDGSIAVESAIGKGSRFTVELGLARADAGATALPIVPNLSATSDHSGLRVLVVDDVDLNRSLLIAQLQRLGADPSGVGDGFEALKALTMQPFDLILLDIQMPGIDGYETAERMRSLANGRRTRIVAVTANAQSSEREHCLAAGMNDYVSKPVRLQTLQRVLAETAAAPTV